VPTPVVHVNQPVLEQSDSEMTSEEEEFTYERTAPQANDMSESESSSGHED
jgi:hypothetical protein